MTKFAGMWICGLMVSACAATGDPMDPVETSTQTSASQSYSPMGFVRVTSSGTAAGGSFNSSGGGIGLTHTSTGNYSVTFNGLGATTGHDGEGGNVQLTAETTTNHKCRVNGWGGAPNVAIGVLCTDVNGVASDTGFAVQFYRYTMPATTNTFPPSIAYSWITASGAVSPFWDYNSTGSHNTVTHTSTGFYTLNIPSATVVNVSIMVSPYGGAAGNVCSVSGWGAGSVSVQCRNAANAPVDNAFDISYAWSGPTLDQQGGHAWFDGTGANASYSSAMGKIEGCPAASVTGSLASALVTLRVTGDLGSWDASPFNRASFGTLYGGGGYCNIQSEFATGTAPSSTGTTIFQCFDPAGNVIAHPMMTFTHVTSDAAGPC